jgi:release factor glutamine methyltransferase
MLSWGRVRRALQPIVLKYWLNQQSGKLVKTHVEGFDLEVFPGVFHPKYFGSSSILARFVSSLPLQEKSFLEIGCGAGVVALSAARKGAKVTAVDINPEAVRCTLTNAARNQLSVKAQVGDLFEPLGSTRFDVIAWNPPFLPGEAKSPGEAAFFGGRNFDLIQRFAKEVRAHLEPGGPVYTILSADIPIEQIEQFFRNEEFAVSRTLSTRWGLGETMVILCAK